MSTIRSIAKLAIIIFFANRTFGQGNSIQRLNIGEPIPDISFKIDDSVNKTFKISDFKGKLLILDFWGVNCLSCIEAIPKMESIQKNLGDKVQIFLITKDKKDAVEALKSTTRVVRNTSLPMIIADTIFSKFFPYKTEPYHVWIDKNGYVNQLTDGINTTEQIVEDYIAGKQINLTVKQEKVDFDPSASLLLEGGGRQLKNLLTYSVMMKRISDYGGAGGGFIRDTETGDFIGIKYINVPILDLFKACIDGPEKPRPSSRCIIRAKNPEKFDWPKKADKISAWAENNTYCYELKIGPSQPSEFYKVMKADLERYFNIRAEISNQNIKCLILKRLPGVNKYKTKGGIAKDTADKLGNDYFLQNSSTNTFVRDFTYANYGSSMPIVDEMNYDGNIDLSIHSRLCDLDGVKKELLKYGLYLYEDYRVIPMLVLTENR